MRAHARDSDSHRCSRAHGIRPLNKSIAAIMTLAEGGADLSVLYTPPENWGTDDKFNLAQMAQGSKGCKGCKAVPPVPEELMMAVMSLYTPEQLQEMCQGARARRTLELWILERWCCRPVASAHSTGARAPFADRRSR